MDYRLKKNKDFKIVLSKGEKCYTSTFSLTYYKAETFKFGIAVGKKYGNAVKRNRIKRLFRVSVRNVITLLNQPYYFVIIPKIKEEYNLKDIERDLSYILKRQGLIADD